MENSILCWMAAKVRGPNARGVLGRRPGKLMACPGKFPGSLRGPQKTVFLDKNSVPRVWLSENYGTAAAGPPVVVLAACKSARPTKFAVASTGSSKIGLITLQIVLLVVN